MIELRKAQCGVLVGVERMGERKRKARDSVEFPQYSLAAEMYDIWESLRRRYT